MDNPEITGNIGQ